MSAKPKDHTKTIQSIKKTVGELRKSVNAVSKGHEKMAAEKDTQLSPEEHKAALDHFASQYKMAKMNGQEDKASEYAKSYHEYAAKMDKHFHSKLKESADFCPECQEDPCVCGGNHLEENMNPYLKEENQLDELSKSTLKSYVDKVATGPSRGKTPTGVLKSIKAIGGVAKAIRKQYEGSNVKEEIEQVDEISKELANRYMHSAFADRKRTDDKMMDLQNKQSTGDKFFRSHKKISKLLAKSDRRTTGISRALNRITKEEVEQVDEISQGLRDRYVKKAVSAHGFASANARMSKDDPSLRSYHKSEAEKAEKRRQGISRALDRMAKEEVENVAENAASTQMAGAEREKAQLAHTKALANRIKFEKKQNAAASLIPTKEEVEQVNELKTSTLSSYLEKKYKKASELPVQSYDRQKGMIHKNPKTGEEMSSREAGKKVAKHLSNIAKAQEKIRKNVNKNVKPTNVDYSSSIQKDYDKNKGRYQGD